MNFVYINSQIAMIINMTHPGGLQQYAMEGGLISSFRTEPGEVHIYHPDLSNDTIEALDKASKEMGVIVRVIEQLNTDEGIDQLISTVKSLDLQNKLIVDLINPTIIVSLHDMSAPEKSKLFKALQDIEGLNSIMVGIGPKIVYRKNTPKPKMENVTPSQTPSQRIIQEDDLLNLKIALNDPNMTFDKFLEQM